MATKKVVEEVPEDVNEAAESILDKLTPEEQEAVDKEQMQYQMVIQQGQVSYLENRLGALARENAMLRKRLEEG